MPVLVVLTEQLLAPVPGGTGRYTRELTAALAATAPPDWTVAGVTAHHGDLSAAVIPGVAGPVPLPLPRRALSAAWQRGLPLWPGGDAVHAPTPLAPPVVRRGRSLIVTVHDTVPWTHPETLTPRGVQWHREMIGRAARTAATLIVPTEAVAADLARRLGPGLRTRVVGEGVSAALAEETDRRRTEEIVDRLALPEGYVLAVGTVEPRKGIDVLIEALADPRCPRVPLLIAGASGWGGVDPRELARRSGLGDDRVRLLGRVSDAELSVVLRRAGALAVPSRAEGFGLPLIEAMSAGVPVVHTDVPALVEVGGGAGRVVPREDPSAFAEALRRVLTEPAVAAAMRAAGRRRAADFTWRRAAEEVWAAHLAARQRR
ncbi:glycosyltransferase involved in cell wall biosynthesis [Actinoalloteichus hoggarensis]|uniref:GDP-mannose-dependent alpha-(1-2)-phosphatidylinositol mannosyltransferase n=1 Tax=Actinoalloteichus hoggarensis TaxID=1470176 RepID=A0A221WB44_9PSEU|nr:glycosyltransferase family 1 protein [Actinoalloteichus hoggarensis]ASO22517.1 GDP-mannose-dependent alpha-(1-2)-phosphatidylinositol mannosyltransferase [Actinoalloteichus hoggarensis]MBB5923059.1 glycosyltransferase involved in cell wall biosynthesis [Actinoalloteichus hoggarensis]